MNTYYKILLGIIALAYLISPLDLIPDLFIPYIGWIDDTFVIGIIIYYLKFGRLPNFFYHKNKGKTQGGEARFSGDGSHFGNNGKSRPENASFRTGKKEKTKKTPHETLGIAPGATREEIHAAYREAVKQYHPDRVAHLGKDLQKLANERFIEIKEAYNILMNT